MDTIIDKYNELREAIEMSNDLDPSLKDELMSKLDDIDGLIDDIMDCQNDPDYDDTVDEDWKNSLT